jgi:RNA polymerase sigma-70 factor, ECF subfamily
VPPTAFGARSGDSRRCDLTLENLGGAASEAVRARSRRQGCLDVNESLTFAPIDDDVQDAQVDSQSVERLYRDQGGRVWSAVFAYAGDRGVADDAVAEAFAQLLRRGDGVRDASTWIWTTAFRLAAGELKRRSNVSHNVPERSYDPEFSDTRVLDAIHALPERQRTAVLLRYYADRPITEVADALGLRASTARVHLHRARKRLKELLGEDVSWD